MGAITSRQNVGVEEVDISINHAYRYPPKSGNYFSSHFIMGGERFETAQPEMYLFGENTDLNFLGSRPAPFPYPALSSSEPSRTLKALVNIRKESLRFVRVPDDSSSLKEPERRTPSTNFNIEFTFDCDVRCAITIMYFCTEEVTSTGLVYTPRDASMNSETYHYSRGANKQFSQVCHVFDPSQYSEDSLLHSFDRDVMPIVIYCIAKEGGEPFQSHATIAVVEKHSDGYSLKPLKQKLFVDGLCYLLQEIYGIENKNTDTKPTADDDPDDNGAECVICMCDLRDTLILPCRHLCLCNCCADSLRYQANNCPICRAPFRALLQIKALQKTAGGVPAVGAPPTNDNGENIPAGYEAVSLIEALNGPSVTPQQPVAPPHQDMYVQLPQSATDGGLDGSHDECLNPREFHDTYNSKGNELEDSTTQTDRPPSVCDATDVSKGSLTQMRMSVLMAQESEECPEAKTKEVSPPSTVSKKQKKGKSSEDVSIRMTETPKCKEKIAVDGSVKKRSKKTNAQSPVSRGASPPFVITETSVSSDQIEDGEEITETLSLLDEINSENCVNGVHTSNEPPTGRYRIQSPVLSNDKNDLDASNELDRVEGLPPDLDGSDSSTAEIGASHKAQVSRSYEGEIDKEGRLTPKDRRSSSKKNKRNNRSAGRQNRTNSSGYNPAPYCDSPSATEDSSPGLAPESQSLPGTPLSHSSAVSRSSDASVSSASSTRALILSHPSQSSTAI